MAYLSNSYADSIGVNTRRLASHPRNGGNHRYPPWGQVSRRDVRAITAGRLSSVPIGVFAS
jgi:hypothetical protein